MADKRYKYNNKNRNLAGNPIHQPTESYKKGWTRIFGKKKEEEDKETEKFFNDIANNTPNSEQFNDEPKTRLEQMAKLKHDPIVD
jgi:hypothetical protein|tara:strand:+ start:428 stop:682 length:255 start_codon:yes stop_codon:yes gene_type:complete